MRFLSYISLVLYNFILFQSIAFAQENPKSSITNLVNNPSFEELKDCPTDYGQIEKAVGWINLNFTPDLFVKCSNQAKISTPGNFFGSQYPSTGSNYAGITAFHENSLNEFIATNLTQPMEKGKKYNVKFRVSLAETYSNYGCNNIGIYFTNDLQETLLGKTPHVKAKEPITEKRSWFTISKTIFADADYTHLVIGNFGTPEETKITKVQKSAYPVAYYYIDDIQVTKYFELKDEENFVKIVGKVLDAETKQPVKARIDFVLSDINYRAFEKSEGTDGSYRFSNMQRTQQFYLEAKAQGYFSSRVFMQADDTSSIYTHDFYLKPTGVGSVMILENLHFETGKAKIKPESFPELNLLAEFMQSHATYHVEIGGHTDNVGDDEMNFKLSENRAEAVVDYLVEHGLINRNRMIHKGYGETLPLTDNDTPEGKMQNRRVELKIVRD
jgi:outer membrane protein OmpA-like peptidoglycan-associated protein